MPSSERRHVGGISTCPEPFGALFFLQSIYQAIPYRVIRTFFLAPSFFSADGGASRLNKLAARRKQFHPAAATLQIETATPAACKDSKSTSRAAGVAALLRPHAKRALAGARHAIMLPNIWGACRQRERATTARARTAG